MAGQAGYSVTYHRRSNIGVLLKKHRKASHMIKENKKALKTKDSNLFGKKLETNL